MSQEPNKVVITISPELAERMEEEMKRIGITKETDFIRFVLFKHLDMKSEE